MWSKLEEVFQALELPYSRQGSYSSDESYPDSFFTFWNADTPEGGFYDDESHKAIWLWYVYFYTNDPLILYSQMDLFVQKAKEKGFIVEGRGNDIQSDQPDYFGRVVRIRYVEIYNN